ncbi:hypothetical protein EV178_004181 [Coemansia sp. RSA 1646]|nr:hypothetical protein EV178_004181 [Coemansia sp. RSA 1646]
MTRIRNSSNISRDSPGSSRSSSDSVGSLDLSSIQDTTQSWYPQDINMSCSTSTTCEDKNADKRGYRNEDILQSTGKSTSSGMAHPDDASDARRSSTTKHDYECADMDRCTMDMAAERECLRKRFKEWSGKMDQTIKRLRDMTDNALVNQNMQLEHILHEGKARIDGIDEEQNNIRTQLSNFVSMLSDAQVHIFTEHRKGESRISRPQKALPVAPEQMSKEPGNVKATRR